MSNIYIVYLTTYFGNKLPPFYIGSTTLDKILNGYHGSVSSKKYESIWKKELKDHPEQFKTVCISKHSSQKEAIIKEGTLQTKLNVVASPLYINQAIANPNGCFGTDVSGKNHPFYGKVRETKLKTAIAESNKRRTGEKRNRKQILRTCPHCFHSSISIVIFKFHFSNCKSVL